MWYMQLAPLRMYVGQIPIIYRVECWIIYVVFRTICLEGADRPAYKANLDLMHSIGFDVSL